MSIDKISRLNFRIIKLLLLLLNSIQNTHLDILALLQINNRSFFLLSIKIKLRSKFRRFYFNSKIDFSSQWIRITSFLRFPPLQPKFPQFEIFIYWSNWKRNFSFSRFLITSFRMVYFCQTYLIIRSSLTNTFTLTEKVLRRNEKSGPIIFSFRLKLNLREREKGTRNKKEKERN